jgi:hypothetical protein
MRNPVKYRNNIAESKTRLIVIAVIVTISAPGESLTG